MANNLCLSSSRPRTINPTDRSVRTGFIMAKIIILPANASAEVPDGEKLAFAMLQKGNVELMYQSYASADKDVGTNISEVVRKGPTFLYVEVDNLDATITAVKGAQVVMPKRKTFYGSTEIGIKDPAGHFVTFAEFAAAAQQSKGRSEDNKKGAI